MNADRITIAVVSGRGVPMFRRRVATEKVYKVLDFYGFERMKDSAAYWRLTDEKTDEVVATLRKETPLGMRVDIFTMNAEDFYGRKVVFGGLAEFYERKW